jgi:hypothetical protein
LARNLRLETWSLLAIRMIPGNRPSQNSGANGDVTEHKTLPVRSLRLIAHTCTHCEWEGCCDPLWGHTSPTSDGEENNKTI